MIEKAQITDANAIARIHVEGWQKAYKGIMPQHYLDSLSIEERAKRWESMLESEDFEVWVFKQYKDVRGWVSFGPSRDKDASDKTAEVRAIYVEPNFWGRGIGRELLAKAMAELKNAGFKEVTLWVLEDNHRTVRFYEHQGFTLCPSGPKKHEIAGKSLNKIRFRQNSL